MKHHKKIKTNNADILLFVSFLIIILILMGALVKKERMYSSVENRSLNLFQHFTISSFIDGSYQKSLEDALADQAIGSETIKGLTSDILNFIDYNLIPKAICEDKYVYLDDGYYNFNCDDYMLKRLFSEFHESVEDDIKETLRQYSNLNNYIDTYYYFITTSSIYNFEFNDYQIDILSTITDNMTGNYKLGVFDFADYNEFKQYFYKTDHHWNYKGSYKGYSEIMKLLEYNGDLIVPEEEVVFDDLIYFGSASRMSGIFDFKEKFTVYKFNFPELVITNNRESNTYGNEELYFNEEYLTDKLTNHYGYYYGGDSGELIIDANDKNKDNLLIISNSYSNAINKLIASHFNKTYIVDMRNYYSLFEEEFEIYKYIKKNNIDKVLVIMNYDFLYGDSFKL